MSGDVMLKDQHDYIVTIQNDCLTRTNMAQDEAWNFAFRCWQLGYKKDKTTLAQAMQTVIEELRQDKSEGSYYYSWQSSIACAIMNIMPEKDGIHALANESAKKFLDLLIDDEGGESVQL